MKKLFYYVEGYGCAFNLAETEQIKSMFDDRKIKKTLEPKKADLIVVNTCAVKDVTEQRMLFRLNQLNNIKKKGAKVFAFGCLAATRKKTIQAVSNEIIVLDTKLESLCKALEFEIKKFSPIAKEKNKSSLVSIIPISVGCVGNCTYCATKLARGNLISYSVDSINSSFKKAIKKNGEIWLTSQDLGCYGFDIGTTLFQLMEKLLINEGHYFVRLGMMNPNHFLKDSKNILSIFDDDRVFKFLHLPLQSGSDKILKKMNRCYTSKDFEKCVSISRKKFPNISIATDIIVGFPGETETDFQQTIKILKKIKPDVINISRYAKRPGTVAAKLPQFTEAEKKRRSKIITQLKKEILMEKNKQFVGKTFEVFVSEKKPNEQFVARTIDYRPVVVDSGFGKKIKVKITSAFTTFFMGKLTD